MHLEQASLQRSTKISRHKISNELPSPTIFDCCVVLALPRAPFTSSTTPNTSNHHWRAGSIILGASLHCLAHRAPSTSSIHLQHCRPTSCRHPSCASHHPQHQCHSPNSGWQGKMMGLFLILKTTQYQPNPPTTNNWMRPTTQY